MGVLRFTASGSNRLKWTTLAQALKDVSDGAWTCAFLVKMAANDANYAGFGYLLSSTGDGVAEAGLGQHANDNLFSDIGSVGEGPSLTSTTESYFVVASKAAGSSVITYSRYVESTATWTHSSPAGSIPNQIDATMLELGAWQNGDFFDGWMGVAAFWEGAMSQANKEALVTNWQTSDLWTSAHGQPAFLVELNVAAASVTDLAGNASSSSHVGTALDSGETLASWNFDGTGSGSAVQASRGLSYDVQNAVQASRGLSYDVLNAVQAPRGLNYDVLAAVLASRALSYDVLAGVQASRLLNYDVIGSVLARRGLVYDLGDVETPAGATRQGLWLW